MQYPIDVEKYLAAAQMELGAVPSLAEEATRAVIPAVNLCYERGRAGTSGYPLSPATEIRRLETATGQSTADCHELLAETVRWMNEAYEQGRQEAAR